MAGYTDLDVLAIHRHDYGSREIELEKALEGAFLEHPPRGLRRVVRGVQGRAELDWSHYLFINRRTA